MSQPPKLSVIIPVYRTEAYLRECLDSVASQTLQGLEVIIVNDGSPDDSQRILNAYCSVFKSFSCIETENRGQSAARNTGLDKATGEYVTFLDSDDRLPPDAYEALVTAADRTGAEICVGVAESFNDRRQWLNSQMRELLDITASHATLGDLLPLVRDASPCNKVFSRELLERLHLRFPVGIGLREDLHLVLRAFAAARNITVIPSTIYCYRARNDDRNRSRTEEVNPKVFDDLLWVSRDLDTHLRGKVSEVILREKNRAFLGYIPYRLFSYLLEASGDETAVVDKIRGYLAEQPDGLVEELQAVADRLLLLLVAAGDLPAARTLCRYKARGSYHGLDRDIPASAPKIRAALAELLAAPASRDRRTDFRKQLQRLQKRTVARGKEILANVEPPSLTSKALAREAKLAAARVRRRIDAPLGDRESNIWLVGERRGMSAEDTGFAFFRYLRTQHPEVESYFVTRPDAPGAREATKLGNVLRYGTAEAYEKLLRARVIAYSDNGQDFFHLWKRVVPFLRPDLVGCFLQHGVIGMSAMGDYYSKLAMEERGERCDLFVTSTKSEKQLVVKHLGFEDRQVVVTGLSRFDALATNRASEREILFVPTWRSWLRTAETDPFLRSEFAITIHSLLGDRRLHALLEEHDFRLVYVNHFAMAAHSSHLRDFGPRIQVVGPKDGSIQHFLQRARLLVTDYSSVAYDQAFQRRPVLFYQFDAERFYLSRGMMLIDPTQDMMGEVVRTQDEVLSYLADFLRSDHSMPAKYRARADAFFAGLEGRSCDRIFEALVEAQRAKQALR